MTSLHLVVEILITYIVYTVLDVLMDYLCKKHRLDLIRSLKYSIKAFAALLLFGLGTFFGLIKLSNWWLSQFIT